MNQRAHLNVPLNDSNFEPHHVAAPCVGSVLSGSTNSNSSPCATSEQRKEAVVNIYASNIVLFGETGVGKSSIVNLIAGQELAHTSNNALGCTFRHQQYTVALDGASCALWDTTGLDEGSEGTVPAAVAENNLKALIQGLARTGGIHLVIYCIRASRLTKALQRNYDLFYVTVCRKKVPVALVVTGLEHQQGRMEAWWDENEAVLRRSNMWFDAHACVTTLDVNDDAIQERRSDSQKRLRELVVGYSRSPAWKTEPSFISRVLPMFRAVLHNTPSTSGQENAKAIRKVIVCDVAEDIAIEFSPGITAIWERCTGRIGDGQYELVRVDKDALETPTPMALEDVEGVRAGVLVFYTSNLVGARISSTDVDALKTFYDIAGGQMCPMIVALRGCDDDEAAQACLDDIASHHGDIQVHVVPLPTAKDDQSGAQAMLNEAIEKLCIEHVEIKISGSRLRRTYNASKRLIASIVEEVAQADRTHAGGLRRGTRRSQSPIT